MQKSSFDTIYQYFTSKANKCNCPNHLGIPIYYCSEPSCQKQYICSECLTEEPEHFTLHVKYFIPLDTKKNFFKFFQIPLEEIEEQQYSYFMKPLRSKLLFNKDKISDVNSFYEYIKNQIDFNLNLNKKNYMLRDEKTISDYYSNKKNYEQKNNDFINNNIKDFIKKNDKHQISNFINKIKPALIQSNSNCNDKEKLDKINNLLNNEISILLEKCLKILCEFNTQNNIDNIDNNTSRNINENENIKKENYENFLNKDNNEIEEEYKIENEIDLNNKEDIINKDVIEKSDIKIEKNNNFILEDKSKNKITPKFNKFINIINDLKPIQNDINIFNIEYNNNNKQKEKNIKNSMKKNKSAISPDIQNNSKNNSFYEGSINNISSIKTLSNIETEEFESKININLNSNIINDPNTTPIPSKNLNFNILENYLSNNLHINQNPIHNNLKIAKNIPVKDYFFDNSELDIKQKFFKNYPKNIKSYKNKESYRNSNSINKNNKENVPMISVVNDINNANAQNCFEIKFNQFYKKDDLTNADKIIKESNQFVIDIKKSYVGKDLKKFNNNKSSINISIDNFHKKYNPSNKKTTPIVTTGEKEKLNVKTKENLNRLDKIRNQIGKLLK